MERTLWWYLSILSLFLLSDSLLLEWKAEDKADVKLNKTKVGARVRIFPAACISF